MKDKNKSDCREYYMHGMAEQIENGDFCQLCGEYMGDGDGYPRSCEGCK